MLATTVREEWSDFENKCLNGAQNEVKDKFRHVFYAAYNAAVLQVMVLIRTGETEEAIVRLIDECEEYWRGLPAIDSDGGAPD